jgi:hypothetical protein
MIFSFDLSPITAQPSIAQFFKSPTASVPQSAVEQVTPHHTQLSQPIV